ncbi:hypothetical protein [Plantactinospora soyae]|uniref:Uncharacterized protein n=1 Tax=Plantactinospora soyae TaxID=1544732 RepID=A0A927R6H0_9ACTN|nr:hypothetical protein [Plantactinospora soyae]MBE1486856.1 hypothetical protein [Plantactinospora soyae]
MSHTGSPDSPGATHGMWRATTAGYAADEWQLLTRLPGRVIVAASSTGPENPVRAVTEGLAGLDGIAAGRSFDSELVRAVVATIYAESDDGHSASVRPDGSDGELAELLRSCRSAVEALARHADPADSAAYRQWVQSVAARVCRAAGPDGRPRPFGDPVDPAHRRLLDQLGEALGLRSAG